MPGKDPGKLSKIAEALTLNNIFSQRPKRMVGIVVWDPIDYSLPGSSVHGISQARILEWVAISFSRLLLLLLLSCFSRVQLCVTPQTAAHQAPLSLGFSRQEHWSGLPLPSPNMLSKLVITFLPRNMYIFEINYLSIVSFAIIFSHSEGCLFTLLVVSFVVQKLLILIRSCLFVFAFISITQGGGS